MRNAPQGMQPSKERLQELIIAAKHVDYKHITAAVGGQAGNPVPKREGGVWDHATEVGDAVRGLRNNSKKLEASTDPAAIKAVEKAQETIKKAEDAIKGAGI